VFIEGWGVGHGRSGEKGRKAEGRRQKGGAKREKGKND
jgi:hypothetical protein